MKTDTEKRFFTKHQKKIAELCERYQVKHLSFFGSVTNNEFKETSDLDVAVVFDRQSFEGSFEQYMGLKEDLENLFNRPVDLVISDKIRNPLLAKEIEQTKEVIYAA